MSESDDCLFCKIIAGQIPSSKVYEDETTYAFNDINPKAKVHVLVVPKKPNLPPTTRPSWPTSSPLRRTSPTRNFTAPTDWCSTPVSTPARPSSTCTRT